MNNKVNQKTDKRRKPIIIALIIFVVLLLCVFLIFFKSCKNNESNDGVSYNAEVTVSDDTPLGEAGSLGRITFPGFSKSVVKYSKSKKMSLQNPKSNKVNFVYTISYKGKEVFASDQITPGKTVKWNLHEFFKDKGKYTVDILITPYSSDGNAKNGILQTFSFEVT